MERIIDLWMYYAYGHNLMDQSVASDSNMTYLLTKTIWLIQGSETP